ncbi:DEAD/DEAH box helicase family protein [Mycolicibacterium sp. 3033]|nr:DEAD/DEAH box helicase family protein [Mycolicibacterium aurantiacum]
MPQKDAEGWNANAGLEQEVEEQFGRAIASYRANPHLIAEHAGLEESIRVGGYAHRTLLELVQNAADAMSGVDTTRTSRHAGRVEIVLDVETGTLYCANAGRPFSKSGLIALMHAYMSHKRGDEIGRFGLGFKSVLAVTETPIIFSRSVSFEFNSKAAREALAEVADGTKKHPVLRTPTLIDAQDHFASDPILDELGKWAVTIVKLPGASASTLKRLRNEIESFSSEFLLFVSSVREVKLRVLDKDGIDTSHVSRDLGDGVLKIERPDGKGGEWIVQDRMHSPSMTARQEVGEAVSRDMVKVTVALPVRNAQQRVGRFWSYFPLQDDTSASALFNAPWSVNDDRTTLLHNDYNREIVHTLAEMFVSLLPKVTTAEDPAAHLDYLPARGRENRVFGNEILCSEVPLIAADFALVPDAKGTLRSPAELKPLDFGVTIEETAHRAWIESPNTGEDVPHWRCYTSTQRMTRLRQLFAVAVGRDVIDEDSRDMKRALELMPKRGLLSWLREWAEGTDTDSAANAFKFVARHPELPSINQAKVIQTTEGLRALGDRNMVFLEKEEDLDIEGSVFVDSDFLARPGIAELLRKAGFRNLNPIAILNARLSQLSSDADDAQLARFWESVNDVQPRDALDAVRSRQHLTVKVPTRDGGWAWPAQVFDLTEPLTGDYTAIMLDRARCVPEVAYALGVIRAPVKDYAFDDEPLHYEYESWVIQRLNSELGPGDRPVERISLYPTQGFSPGPFSLLQILDDANASPALRETWTRGLLSFGDAFWDCEDSDSGVNRRVPSPVRWAVEKSGIVNSTRGFRAPNSVAAPSLARYRDLLPLFMGPSHVANALELPDLLEHVPATLLREALESELLPPTVSDDVLVEFILVASRVVFPGAQPRTIPCRIGRAVESRSPRAVFTATTDEQRDFLDSRQKPFLFTTPERAQELMEVVGCQSFEDTFAFSMLVEGTRSSERVLDVFTGLRGSLAEATIGNAELTRAAAITKRVTTQDGVEDQSLDWHLDGFNLYINDAVDDDDILPIINDAFSLQLNHADLANVRQAGVDHRLEKIRLEANAADTDSARLEIYFGDDDLRDALPKGLWQALEFQELVNESTSVAELYLTVYGADSIKFLADMFRSEGFPDVPVTWAGGATTISWLRKMGFAPEYAGRRTVHQEAEFVVPGKIRLNELHPFQKTIRKHLKEILTRRDEDGKAKKAMVELPTGAGKTRVATETVLRLFKEEDLLGPVLWIAQSKELCEQAVQTWSTVWRGLDDERPLTVGRLWENNDVHEPDTEFSVVVATDAKLDVIRTRPEYEWLSQATAVIIDEGHRAGDSELYTRLLNWLGVAGRGWARPLVGLSATPFKGTSQESTKRLATRFGNVKLKAFEENAYRELADLGILARVRHRVLTGVAVEMSAAERNEATNLRRINQTVLDRIGQDHQRMSILVRDIMELDPNWPVLVFTPSVLSAQVLAATLRYRGVIAESVSGQTGRQQRRDVIDKFKRGHIRVLTNCDLLIQGFDAPGVRALYIARPTFSPNAYIQMAGRGLRGPKNGGKEECLIVDMADNFGDINEYLGFREYEDLWQEQEQKA